MDDTLLALDIGGTKVAAALVTTDGEIVAETQRPTLARVDGRARTGDEVYTGVADALRELLADVAIPSRVGIGSAGPLALAEGTISPLNIPGWRGFPIVARVSATLADLGAPGRVPVLIGDGHCVALGEQWRGAGQGHDDLIGVICSTGVGAGVVLGGVALQGVTGNAMHLGHAVVQADGRPCVCGGRGCVEALSSGTSMVAIARERGWQGPDAIALTADARAGDRIALAVVDEGMRALAAGLASAAVMFDVGTIVVGGGVAKAGEIVFEPLRRHFAELCKLGYVADRAEILAATLPNAGLLGAAKAALAAPAPAL